MSSKNVDPARQLRVLIAHQSTIPHYRVKFYELLEKNRPAGWSFEVVYDTVESASPRMYLEPVNWRAFGFPILDARTHLLTIGGRRLLWQNFFLRCRRFDAIITDTHIVNLTYLAVWMWRVIGGQRIFWGHVSDGNEAATSTAKRWAERFKAMLLKRSDFFLAYTPQQADLLTQKGYPPQRIVVLNNTIDVDGEREYFNKIRSTVTDIRHRLGVDGCRVLLYVGRLLPSKRIDFLLRAFEIARRRDASLHLFIVGAGPEEERVRALKDKLGSDAVTYFGPLVKQEELGPIWAASDLFVIPALVGLAPVQAACYDLPTITFDGAGHGPEIDYLMKHNSDILPAATSAEEFADMIPALLEKWCDSQHRAEIFPTVAHLTLGNMVAAFIEGVNKALKIHC